MGKPTGFLEYERRDNGALCCAERIKSFDEFHPPLSENERREQGARCMNCGVPFCQSAIKLSGMVTGCPLHNLIPEWNDEVYNGNFSHALSRLTKTASFPEFTGRVCPALCEKACVCGKDGDAVTVRENELFIIEYAFEHGLVKPRVPAVRTEKKVAVVGSGPSGLACADLLNRRGHNVTVFEREDRVGGLLMYGIPNMKLDKSVVSRRERLMRDEGVEFVTNADIGKNIAAKTLLEQYDAVALCCGAKKPRVPNGVDMSVKGVSFAVDFLTDVTKRLVSGKKLTELKGKNVVIVGGGDTGNDCVGSCVRLGAASVIQLEMMPCPPEARLPNNPWPEWPRVKKTDYGQQEAAAVYGADPRVFETTITGIETDKGALCAVNTSKVCFKDGKLTLVPGSEKRLCADVLLVAAGFVGCEDYTAAEFGVGLTDRGVVKTESEAYATNIEKVFSCGDMRRGQSLVVWAIAEGRGCAREIDAYLMGYTGL